MGRTTKKLKVVKKPDANASILRGSDDGGPTIQGDGDNDLVCGECSFVLVSGDRFVAPLAAPVQMLALCPKCGAHNALPAIIIGH